MNTAKTAPAAAPFDGCCNSLFGNLVGLKNTTGHSNAFFGGAAGIANTTGSFNSDRKSTRLNSSHRCISYAVFCLKKKKKNMKIEPFNQLLIQAKQYACSTRSTATILNSSSHINDTLIYINIR